MPKETLPTKKQLPQYIDAVKQTAQFLKDGASVMIHCDSGTKRTGTVAYAVLRYLDISPEDAVALIKTSREPAASYLDEDRKRWAEDLVALVKAPAASTETAVAE
jgi:protein-tyrosine phosphatase